MGYQSNSMKVQYNTMGYQSISMKVQSNTMGCQSNNMGGKSNNTEDQSIRNLNIMTLRSIQKHEDQSNSIGRQSFAWWGQSISMRVNIIATRGQSTNYGGVNFR